jgi:hypothetical protein
MKTKHGPLSDADFAPGYVGEKHTCRRAQPIYDDERPRAFVDRVSASWKTETFPPGESSTTQGSPLHPNALETMSARASEQLSMIKRRSPIVFTGSPRSLAQIDRIQDTQGSTVGLLPGSSALAKKQSAFP